MRKRQWIGIVVLLVLLCAVRVSIYFTQKYVGERERDAVLQVYPEREAAFAAWVDSVEDAQRRGRASRGVGDKYVPQPEPFDPNVADSALLVKVGLRPWMAKNLIAYRSHGKIFRYAHDMRSLYGMSDSLYACLEPYIQIDTLRLDSVRGMHAMRAMEKDSSFARVRKCDTIIELNRADTAELMLISGVGRYTAQQIIRYREMLGGFVAPAQIREISAIPAQRADSIIPHYVADTLFIRRIDVNRASVRMLQRHPYISYNQAEQVYDLRRRKVRLRTADALQGIFTADELERIRPYLVFGE